MVVMFMIMIIMTKSLKGVMKVGEVSEGYLIHVKMGSTPACSNTQAADVAKVVSIGMIVT